MNRLRDLSLFIAGGEDLGLNKVKFSWSPLWIFECYLTEVIPPNNIWWLPRSPAQLFIFQANLNSSPSKSFQSFQWSPFWVLSYDWSPLFCPKNQATPPKILPSPPAINNDRSLRFYPIALIDTPFTRVFPLLITTDEARMNYRLSDLLLWVPRQGYSHVEWPNTVKSRKISPSKGKAPKPVTQKTLR